MISSANEHESNGSFIQNALQNGHKIEPEMFGLSKLAANDS